jgi:hypothetical protein
MTVFVVLPKGIGWFEERLFRGEQFSRLTQDGVKNSFGGSSMFRG